MLFRSLKNQEKLVAVGKPLIVGVQLCDEREVDHLVVFNQLRHVGLSPLHDRLVGADRLIERVSLKHEACLPVLNLVDLVLEPADVLLGVAAVFLQFVYAAVVIVDKDLIGDNFPLVPVGLEN